MDLTIKQMETPEEIEGKSLVHWQTWREAYDDLLPAEFQETMTLERCRFLICFKRLLWKRYCSEVNDGSSDYS